MGALINNLRYALRVFSRRREFAIVVVLTLAVGIGTSTAIFSFVNAILLDAMPFERPEELVIIESLKSGEKGRVSQREIADILENTTAFDDAAGYIPEAQYNLTERGTPEEIPSNICQGNLFSVLGVKFIKGGAWPKEFDMRRSFGIVMTEELWKRKFQGDNNIVNETITLDAYPGYTVFGVVPSGFDFPKGMQMFRSATIRDSQVTDRNARNMIVLGRLRGDATIDEARVQLGGLSKMLADKYPESNGAISFSIMPLRDLYVGPIKPYLLLATVAVLFVLFIACINVSNLLLSAGAERDKEVAIRSVMGAKHRSIIAQFLTESLILSLTGGLLGILLGAGLLYLFKNNLSKDLPYWIDIGINTRVLLFSLAISVFSGLVSGLMPALKTVRLNLTRLLKESRGSSGGAHRHKLRKALVVVQLSLSIVLMTGTLLLLQSFNSLKRSQLGFNPDNMLTYRVALPWRKYINREQSMGFYRQLMIELTKIPGVTHAALNDNLPLSYDQGEESRDDEFTISGQSFEEQQSNPYIKYQIVTPGYRDMMEIPLIEGRWINEFDDTLTTPIAVISKTMAMKVFKGENAIGKQIKVGKPDSPSAFRTIIGIVGDVRHDDMRNSEGFQVYLSRWQVSGSNSFILLKTKESPMQYAPFAMKAVAAVDGEQSVYDLRIMQDRIDEKLWQDRVIGEIFSLFAIVSLTLTLVGIYSVMSYAVTLRTKEFGVRRVFGAGRSNIIGIVLKEVVMMCFVSLGFGLLLSAVAADSLSTILYDTSWTRIDVYLLVVTLAFMVALTAAVLPALRATRINPVKALKNE